MINEQELVNKYLYFFRFFFFFHKLTFRNVQVFFNNNFLYGCEYIFYVKLFHEQILYEQFLLIFYVLSDENVFFGVGIRLFIYLLIEIEVFSYYLFPFIIY